MLKLQLRFLSESKKDGSKESNVERSNDCRREAWTGFIHIVLPGNDPSTSFVTPPASLRYVNAPVHADCGLP